MLLVLFAVAGFAVLFAESEQLDDIRSQGLASLFYVTNWWYIFSDTSYFEAIGRPPFLAHLWSLAVEEQFYLLWPAVVWLLLRWRGRGAVFYVAIAGALASTAWMAFLAITNGYPPGGGPQPGLLRLG